MSDRHEELKERLLAAVEGKPLPPSSNPELDDELEHLLEAIEKAPKDFLAPAWVMNEQGVPGNPPPEIEGYKILGILGHGGMGIVYRARQSAPLDREVALKVVRREVASDAGLERFEHESSALARLNHPNIAKVLETGQDSSGQPYVAMELVDGEPLKTFVSDNELQLEELLEIFESVCRGVAHAHACGVIHRDLKPSNILVEKRNGRPVARIIDFGIAKFIDGDIENRLTLTNQVFGTLEYISPEIVANGAGVADVRSDVYSLGSILYELLTDTPPVILDEVRKQSLFRALKSIHEAVIPKPSERIKNQAEPHRGSVSCASDLDCIVLHSLERAPADRYQSAEAFADDIQRFLNIEPIRANPPGLLKTFAKFVRRNRVVVGSISLVLVSLVAGLVAAIWGYFEAERSKQVALNLQEDNVKAIELLSEAAMLANVHDPTAKEHLAGLGDRIEQVLEDTDFESPQAKVQLQVMLATSYTNRGKLDAARNLLLDAFGAVNARDAQLLPKQRFQLLILLAENSIKLQKTDEAEEYAREAIASAESMQGSEKKAKTAQAEFVLANTLLTKGQLDEAEKVFRKVLEQPDISSELDSKMTRARSQVMLASILVRKGKREQALEYSSEGFESYRDRYGFAHPQTLMAGHNHAIILTTLKRNDEAVELFDEVLENRKLVLGHDHTDTLMTMTILAKTFATQQQVDKAIPLYESVISLGGKRESGFDPATTLAATRLARIKLKANEFDEAKSLYEKLTENAVAQHGPKHWRVAYSRARLAEVHLLAGEADLAIEIGTESYEQVTSAIGKDSRYAMAIANTVASAYKDIGNAELAGEWARKASKEQRSVK